MRRSSHKNQQNEVTTKRVVMLSSEIPHINVMETEAFLQSPGIGFKGIAEGLQVYDSVDIYSGVIPDVLRHAHIFNTRMINDRNDEAVVHWIGLISALLLAPQDKLEIRTVQMSTTAGSLFMRAVGKSLLTRKPQDTLTSITLFLYKGKTASAPLVPIAFAINYDKGFIGSKEIFPELIFPVAEIASPLDCDLPWYTSAEAVDQTSEKDSLAARKRTYYYFENPISTLSQSVYLAEGKALRDALIEMCHGNPMLSMVLEPYCNQIRTHGDNLASPVALRSDIVPGIGGMLTLDADIVKLSGYLTDFLYLIQRETPNLVSLQNASFLEIKRKESDHNAYFSDAIMPLNTSFADYLLSLDDKKREVIINSLQKSMTLTEECYKDTKTYTLNWIFEGKSITKRYSQGFYTKEDPLSTKHFPKLAIWPRAKFIEKNEQFAWKHYYIYTKNRPEDDTSIDIYPPLSTAGNEIKREDDRVVHTEDFPEILTITQDGIMAGLLLIKPNNDGIGATGSSRIISIDFGTSNTIAYWKDCSKGTVPKPIPLKSYLLPISTGDNESDYSLSFISGEDFAHDLFISMLRVIGTNGMTMETKALLGSTIPFTTNFNIDGALRNELHFDLKWYRLTDVASRSRTSAFLSQLVQMYSFAAKMDGCTYLFWRFSWPRAMTVDEYNRLKSAIHALVNDYSTLPHNITMFSESDAVGDYITSPAIAALISSFRWRNIMPQSGFACLDIGGGTVDISLWQNNNLCAEASLRDMAGNTVLCKTIVHDTVELPARTELIRELFNNINLSDIEQGIGDHLVKLLETNREQFVKAWALNIDTIAKAIRMQFKNAENLEHVRAYYKMIEVYLSAIVYFTALMVKHAIEEGKMHDNFTQDFSLLFSGNGSQMIRFLHFGDPQDFQDADTYDRLRVIFARGLGREAFPQIIVPLKPKHEIAYGMASRPLSQKEQDAQSRWDTGHDQVSDNMNLLMKMFNGDVEDANEEAKLAWFGNGDYVQQRQPLCDLYRDFWQTMMDVNGNGFNLMMADVFGIHSQQASDTLEQIVRKTNNIIGMLDADNAREHHDSLVTLFTFVLQKLIIQSRG